MQPLRGLPSLLHVGMQVCLTPPALGRERFSTVEAIAGTAQEPRVRFSCSCTLDDAEGIAGCYVLAREDALELGPLDVAFADLLGRRVIDCRHGELGVIESVMEMPANDVWVVAGGPFGEVLIPVIESVVPAIPDAGPIEVCIMDGLLNPS